MKKSMIAIALALAFAAASTMSAYAFTCEVKAVDGKNVTLDCKEKYAQKLTAGAKVKVSAKQRKAIEGC